MIIFFFMFLIVISSCNFDGSPTVRNYDNTQICQNVEEMSDCIRQKEPGDINPLCLASPDQNLHSLLETENFPDEQKNQFSLARNNFQFCLMKRLNISAKSLEEVFENRTPRDMDKVKECINTYINRLDSEFDC